AGLARRVAAANVVGETTRRLAQLGHLRLQLWPFTELEHELAAGRTQRFVDAGEHPPQPVSAVDGEQPEPRGIVLRAELGQRRLERLPAQHTPLAVVDDPEARVDARRERMRAQQPVTEPVNGRDPGAVERARELGTSTRSQLGADAAAQLAGR